MQEDFQAWLNGRSVDVDSYGCGREADRAECDSYSILVSMQDLKFCNKSINCCRLSLLANERCVDVLADDWWTFTTLFSAIPHRAPTRLDSRARSSRRRRWAGVSAVGIKCMLWLFNPLPFNSTNWRRNNNKLIIDKTLEWTLTHL